MPWVDAQQPVKKGGKGQWVDVAAAPQPETPWYKKAATWAQRNVVRPGLEMGGLVAGGVIGGAAATIPTSGIPTPLTAAGGVAGAGIGYSMGRQAADVLEEQFGLKEPEPLPQRLRTAASDVATGAELEMGGQVAGKVGGWAAKKAGKGARRLYQSTIKPSTAKAHTLSDIEKLVETGLEHGSPVPKRAGLDRVTGMIKSLGNKVDPVITEGAAGGDTLSREKVLSGLAQLKRSYATEGSAAEDNAVIDMVAERIRRDFPEQIPTDMAQRFKKGLYRRTFEDTRGGQIEREAYKRVARGFMRGLEDFYPSIAAPNKEMGRLIELAGALEQTAKREGSTNIRTNPLAMTDPLGVNMMSNLPSIKAWTSRRLYGLGKLAPGETGPAVRIAPQAVAQAGLREFPRPGQPRLPGGRGSWAALPPGSTPPPQLALPPGQGFDLRGAPEQVATPFSPEMAARLRQPQAALPAGQGFELVEPTQTPQPWHLQPTPRGEPPAPAPETGQGTLASQTRQFPAPPQSEAQREARRQAVPPPPGQQQTLGAAITKPDWEGVRARQRAKKGRIIEPQTYHQYVKQSGGIRDTAAFGGEELAEFKRFPGLVNKSGAHMDELAERSIKDGWLPEGSTESDALNLLKQDLRNKAEGKPRIRAEGRPSTAELRAQDEAEMRDKGGIKAGELAERLKPGDRVRGYLAGTKEDTYTYQGEKGGKHVFRDKETVRLNPGQWVERPERAGSQPWHKQPPTKALKKKPRR